MKINSRRVVYNYSYSSVERQRKILGELLIDFQIVKAALTFTVTKQKTKKKLYILNPP